MVFHVTVLGASGGPVEGSTMAILIRGESTNISARSLCVDGGSGLGSLLRIFAQQRNKKQPLVESYYENDFEPLEKFTHEDVCISHTFAEMDVSKSTMDLAMTAFGAIQDYFITHSHIDHVAGLVVNSPAFFDTQTNRKVYGMDYAVEAVKKHLFNEHVWPDLTFKGSPLQVLTLNPDEFRNVGQFNVKPFKVSHGKNFYSTAFLIEKAGSYLVIFGDVESDNISKDPSFQQIWEYLGQHVDRQKLRAIFIECSNFDTEKDPLEIELYGHMSPHWLAKELHNLDTVYQKKNQTVANLEVYITHVKQVPYHEDPRLVILSQLNKHNPLKIKYSMALAGFTYKLM